MIAKKWTRTAVIGGTVAMMMVALAGCGGSTNKSGSSSTGSTSSSTSSNKPLTVVNVAQNSAVMQPGLAFLYIGEYLGYDKAAGIKVNVVQTNGPSDALGRLAAGSVDVALPPPAAVMTATAKGHDLGLVTPFMLRRHSEYAFAVLPNSPIKTYSQIVGKKVGVTNLNNEGVQFTEYAMQTLGKPRTDETFVSVGNTGQAAAEITQGHVDVLCIPTVQLATITGPLHVKLRIITPPFASQIIGNAIWFKKSFVKSHPKVVQAYVTAFTKSIAFFVTNPKASLQIFFKMYPQAVPNGDTVQQAVARYVSTLAPNIVTFQPTKTCPQFGCNEKSAWQTYVKYLGLDPSKVGPVTNYYTNQFTKTANQDVSQVIKQAKTYTLK